MRDLFTLAFCCLITIPTVFIVSRSLSMFWTGVIAFFLGLLGANLANIIWDIIIEPWMEDDGR